MTATVNKDKKEIKDLAQEKNLLKGYIQHSIDTIDRGFNYAEFPNLSPDT